MKTALTRIVLPFLLFSLTFVSCSGTLVRFGFGYERWKSNVEKKELKQAPWNWVYLEGGSGKEKILMVHGFGGDKDNWTRFAGGLTKKYDIIAVDLPGFGENEKLTDQGYSIDQQVERLDQFTKAIGWDKFHIVGNSMGGCISGVFAAKHPEKILSLGLFAPSGINSPIKSELSKNMENGKNNLIVTNADEFEELMKFVFVNPPKVPSILKGYFAERAVKNAEFNKIVFKDIRKGFPLQENMKSIKSKTLILWGDTDRVLSVSGAEVLEKGISHSAKVILKDVGHVPMLEKPVEVANIYLDFLTK
ncbi:alpha/beta hydrolase family protein [Leptospira broomii serovar Hurstbridge str. 5399]|uniref:Alpha/beta hydrolase family protein n=1 Tax=Leptospira broomii serovar Hurstbridge str. 5399 TaxID=1049789 RepID=T0EXS6_9LEPT|nr:alpha/beta hydrolase [Leptospira broomii]EQA43620.1 alpha/beta hydrolase family protein [Leptospira broomii serovar Hurstbridge str. 5399]